MAFTFTQHLWVYDGTHPHSKQLCDYAQIAFPKILLFPSYAHSAGCTSVFIKSCYYITHWCNLESTPQKTQPPDNKAFLIKGSMCSYSEVLYPWMWGKALVVRDTVSLCGKKFLMNSYFTHLEMLTLIHEQPCLRYFLARDKVLIKERGLY